MARSMKALGWLTVLGGVLIAIAGVIVLAIHGMVWLKTGDASLLGTSAFFWGRGELHTGWLGVDLLAHYYRDFPMGMLVTLGGIGIVLLGTKIVDRSEKRG